MTDIEETLRASVHGGGHGSLAHRGPNHLVQFYSSDDLLAASVAKFLSVALLAGEPAIAVATEAHRELILRELAALGVSVDGVCQSGQLMLFDAHRTLARLMRDGQLDRAAFERELLPMLAAKATPTGGLRAYGEMVDVLWRAGHRTAAFQLESWWTDLLRQYSFTLLCAYAMAGFYKEPVGLQRIVEAHTDTVEMPLVALHASELPPADLEERDRLAAATVAATRRSERLLRITAAVAEAVTSEQVFEAVVDHVGAAVEASSVGLWLVDDRGVTATMVRSIGYTDAARQRFAAVPIDAAARFPALDAIRAKQPIWIESQHELLAAYPDLRANVTRGRGYRISCLPLVAHGRTLGALGLTIEDDTSATEDERDFLKLVARYASQAIERLRLLEVERRSRTRTEQLYRFAEVVVTAQRFEQVLDAALDAIATVLGASRSSILLFDETSVMRFRAWRELSDEYRHAVDGHSPWPANATAPQPVLVPNVETDAAMAAYLPLFRREAIGALAFIPLVAHGKLLGKFMVYYGEPHPFSSEELELATAIASHLASVIARFAALTKLEDTIHYNEMFAGVLAHDLRNPLGAMLTAAQLLLMRQEGEGDRNAKPLSRILSSGQRMTRMIDQLLDVTRARAGGGIGVQPREANLADVCSQVIDELELAYPDWRFRCEVRGDVSGTWDPDRLLQIVSNLIANAGQHGDGKRGIAITIDGQLANQVSLEVHNHGSIPAHLLPTLFDPFRGAQHRREHARGLGLGLFIVKEIVRAHGGSVEVSSTEPAGTTFTVQLPRTPARSSS
ncbi:MAG: GAF domain-containing protein [Kofleriaceae bacterium]